jgi:carbon-monoxide dehydrogenase iron sulfur subunit
VIIIEPPKTMRDKIDRMPKLMTRREFIRSGAAGVLSFATIVAVGDFAWATDAATGTKIALAKGAVLADKSLCSGCRTCEMVCSNMNSEGRNSAALAMVILDKDYIAGNYQPRTCFQCLDPPCLRACPVDALKVDEKSGTNARVIDPILCIGCQKCLKACAEHFAVPRPRFDPEYEICNKCHLCFGDPNCVKYCPTGALRYERSERGLRLGYPLIKGV